MEVRLSDSRIKELKQNEVFVFGSNEAGFHGAGAAKLAFEKFGAKWRKGWGYEGKTFAIPTKDYYVNTLPISKIKWYVDDFIQFAKINAHLKFLVTPIGCGLAGYTPKEIAPLFKEALNIENIYLPVEFYEFIIML
jgi:hypothetical protein